MLSAAEKLEFERAASLRDRLYELEEEFSSPSEAPRGR
jgi:excinuclease UvrABC helicase subunit UvrB